MDSVSQCVLPLVFKDIFTVSFPSHRSPLQSPERTSSRRAGREPQTRAAGGVSRRPREMDEGAEKETNIPDRRSLITLQTLPKADSLTETTRNHKLLYQTQILLETECDCLELCSELSLLNTLCSYMSLWQ